MVPTPSSWSVLAMHAVFDTDPAGGVNEAYEYRVGDDVFHAVMVRDAELFTSDGAADDPAFIHATDTDTFKDIVTGAADAEAAVASGLVRFEGSTAALRRSADLFGTGRIGRPAGDAPDPAQVDGS